MSNSEMAPDSLPSVRAGVGGKGPFTSGSNMGSIWNLHQASPMCFFFLVLTNQREEKKKKKGFSP